MSFFFSNSRRNRRTSDQHSNRPSTFQPIPTTSPPTYRSSQTSPPSYRSDTTAAAGTQNPHERVLAWSAGVPSVASTDTASVIDDQQTLLGSGSVTGTFVDAAASPPPYLYYLVYAEDGAIPSQQPVDSRNPYLGRISANLVAPPRTVNSIKRCICKVEKIAEHTQFHLFA